MRGDDFQQSAMFCYVSCEDMVPQDHPLRSLRTQVDQCLKAISKKFKPLYSTFGRPSVAPEKLLRALLLQMLYSIRSERLLMEQLRYNFLFRWFVGLSMEDAVWDATVFSKNRDRLLEGDIARAFFGAVLKQARAGDLLSDEHFTVDGTLIEAWASEKSFQRREEPPQKGSGARGKVLLHDVYGSRTDPEARKIQKESPRRRQAGAPRACADGQPSRPGSQHLCHRGHYGSGTQGRSEDAAAITAQVRASDPRWG